jgi:hypothetical protein
MSVGQSARTLVGLAERRQGVPDEFVHILRGLPEPAVGGLHELDDSLVISRMRRCVRREYTACSSWPRSRLPVPDESQMFGGQRVHPLGSHPRHVHDLVAILA